MIVINSDDEWWSSKERIRALQYYSRIIISTVQFSQSVSPRVTCYIWRRPAASISLSVSVLRQPMRGETVWAGANRGMPSEELSECSSWRVACDDDMENWDQSGCGNSPDHKYSTLTWRCFSEPIVHRGLIILYTVMFTEKDKYKVTGPAYESIVCHAVL